MNIWSLWVFAVCFALSAGADVVAQEPSSQTPAPTSKIEWAKDLDAAMAQSAKDGRPVITYFTFDT